MYDTPEAYNGKWSHALEYVSSFLQVRSPSRALNRADGDGSGVFESNWKSNAHIDFFGSGKKIEPGQMQTTQGRIYTALWKGDLGVLNLSTEEPPVPLTVRASTRLLNTVVLDPELLSKGDRAFVMPRDRSNQVSRMKSLKVNTGLKAHQCCEPLFCSPESVHLDRWDEIAPTVDIAIFLVSGISGDEVEAIVKKALYVRGKDSKKDMFKLSAHGVLYE